jgi:hypothetical protein
MVVLAHSAVLRDGEKTTLRAAFRMPVNDGCRRQGPGHSLVGGAAHEVRVRALVRVEFLFRLRRVVGQAEVELPGAGRLRIVGTLDAD